MGISRGVLLLERVGGTQVAYAEGVLLLERVGGTQVGEIPGTGGDRARAERCTFTGTRGGDPGGGNPWYRGRSSEGREVFRSKMALLGAKLAFLQLKWHFWAQKCHFYVQKWPKMGRGAKTSGVLTKSPPPRVPVKVHPSAYALPPPVPGVPPTWVPPTRSSKSTPSAYATWVPPRVPVKVHPSAYARSPPVPGISPTWVPHTFQ